MLLLKGIIERVLFQNISERILMNCLPVYLLHFKLHFDEVYNSKLKFKIGIKYVKTPLKHVIKYKTQMTSINLINIKTSG